MHLKHPLFIYEAEDAAKSSPSKPAVKQKKEKNRRSGGQKIEINTMLDFKYLAGLQASPGHKYAAFTVSRADLEGNCYKKQLYLFDNDHKPKLIADEEAFEDFAFESDKSMLIADTRGKKEKELREKGVEFTSYYRLDLEGPGQAVRAFTIPLNVSNIEPLAEEGLFLISGQIDLRSPDLWQLSLEDQAKVQEARKEVAFREHIKEIPFYLNGAGFVYGRREMLFIYDEKNDKLRPMMPRNYSVSSISLSEDRRRIYFAAEETVDKMSIKSRLFRYRLPAEGKFDEEPAELWNNVEILYNQNDFDFGFCFEQEDENKLIVIACNHEEYGVNQSPNPYLLDLSTSLNSRKLVQSDDSQLRMWNSIGSDVRLGHNASADLINNEFFFIGTDNYGSAIFKISQEGTVEKVYKSSYSIDGFVRLDNRIYLIGLFRQALQELYLLDSKPREEKIVDCNDSDIAEISGLCQITNFNKALKDKYVAKPRRVEYNSEADIDGWVLLPENFEKASPTERFPLILDVHGGPRTVYGEVYYHEMQLWANMGYVVAFCNPRGSDGRGDEFADIRGKYGEIDYEDIIEFLDAVLQAYPQVDAKRLGVTGGSYGGYMTNRITTLTDRFAAAATQRSISNWLSFYGNSDIGYYFATDQNNCDTFSDEGFMQMWNHSPMKYVNNVTTPTLIIHATNDFRCPLEQGYQWFTALKDRGVASEIVVFHNETHELSRSGKPKARIERLTRITNWFERYLKPVSRKLLKAGESVEALPGASEVRGLPASEPRPSLSACESSHYSKALGSGSGTASDAASGASSGAASGAANEEAKEEQTQNTEKENKEE